MRKLFCSALTLALCFGVVVAEEKKEEKKADTKKVAEDKKADAKKVAEKKPAKKKGSSARGGFKKFDAATGTLSITVKVKKVDTDKEFKVPETAKVVVWEGETKKQGTAKDGLVGVKEGTTVAVNSDADGKVVAVTVGVAPKKAAAVKPAKPAKPAKPKVN